VAKGLLARQLPLTSPLLLLPRRTESFVELQHQMVAMETEHTQMQWEHAG